MKRIPLTQGKYALVDDEDYDAVARYKWCVSHADRPHCYATRQIRVNGKRVSLWLHRVLMNAPPHLLVDHKDGNGLNCQRSNMRLATRAQNNRNCIKRRNAAIGFKGVRTLDGKTWYAYINVDGKPKHFGGFRSAKDAALHYDQLAKQHYGEFARTNF